MSREASRGGRPPEPAAEGMRLDKWLWAARLYKTRSLAREAVAGGKVHLNGRRVKPAHTLRPGDRLEVSRGSWTLELVVRALAGQRRPAPEAARLYEETEASRRAREEAAARRRLEAAAPRPAGRPDKRQRRELRRLRGR